MFCNICWTDHIEELEEKLQNLLKQLDECQEKLNHKIENLEIRCNHLKEVISYTTEEKIAKIREAEKKALIEVDKLKNEGFFNSNTLKTQILNMKNTMCEKYKKADNSQKVCNLVTEI